MPLLIARLRLQAFLSRPPTKPLGDQVLRDLGLEPVAALGVGHGICASLRQGWS